MQPKYKERPSFRVIGIEVLTTTEDGRNKEDCPAVWHKFMPRIEEIKNNTPGICYGLCIMLNDTEFRYIAGVESSDKVPRGMIEIKVPASKYAVFTHRGLVTEINKTWDDAYTEGLSDFGKQENKKGISFELYDDRYSEDENNETDIYIPIK